MNRFDTGRKAKEYLIHRILTQADQDGVSLSDVERKMLYFSETCWTLPDMMAVDQAFDEKYDQDEYEDKISQIVQRIHDQPGSDRDGSWDQAVSRLRDEDHYLLVLIDGAGSRSANLSRWDIVRFALAGAVAVALYFPLLLFIDSHVSNPTISKLVGDGTFLAVVILTVYFANRLRRKSA